MKNVKKVLAVMTAAASLMMSGSALAANQVSFTAGSTSTGFNGSYADGKFTVSATPTVAAGTEMTLLILREGTNLNDIKNADILYIDQATEGTTGAFSGMGLATDIAEEVTTGDGHLVRLGYYYDDTTSRKFGIAEGRLKVSAAGGVKVLWGDVTGNGEVDASDASAIVTALLGGNKVHGERTIGTEYITGRLWGDVTDNGEVDASDASAIVTALLGGNKVHAGFTIGQEATVTPIVRPSETPAK